MNTRTTLRTLTALITLLIATAASGGAAELMPYAGTPIEFEVTAAGYEYGVRAEGMLGLRPSRNYLAIRLDADAPDGTVFAVRCRRSTQSNLVGSITVALHGGYLMLDSQAGPSPAFPLEAGMQIEVWGGERELMLVARVPDMPR